MTTVDTAPSASPAPDAAFDRLREESQRRNVRLAELAAALVAGVAAG
jgi:hypothetical protein